MAASNGGTRSLKGRTSLWRRHPLVGRGALVRGGEPVHEIDHQLWLVVVDGYRGTALGCR
jgi:hypothetical protein